MDKRIAGFRFSGNLRKKEHLVKKVYVSKNILAKSIERIATEIAIVRGYERVNDKNLGLGYTEWFYVSGEQIKSCILQAYRIVKKENKKRGKGNVKIRNNLIYFLKFQLGRNEVLNLKMNLRKRRI